MDFLIGNNFCNSLIFRPIRIRENREKNSSQLPKYFGIGNHQQVNIDSGKIIFVLSGSVLRCTNRRQHYSFHHYSLFCCSLHLFWLWLLCVELGRSLNSTLHIKSNPFHRRFQLPIEPRPVSTVVLLCYTEKKNIHYYGFAVGFSARIEICLTLETGNKCIVSLEITSVIVWFFDQSEFEKIRKKMKLN